MANKLILANILSVSLLNYLSCQMIIFVVIDTWFSIQPRFTTLVCPVVTTSRKHDYKRQEKICIKYMMFQTVS